MTRTSLRGAAAAWAVYCGLLLVAPWQLAQAAPILFEKASANGASDDSGRFTASLLQGSNGNQALLQLITTADPGARITGLYLQDTTGAIASDLITGKPTVQLSPTELYDVRLDSPGANRIAVIKTLTDTLGITLSEARALVDKAPVVIRSAFTSDGNAQLKQALENAGASVTLSSRQDPSVPTGTNSGVTMPGTVATGYDVELTKAGDNKVRTIKTVQELTGLGLSAAKKLVDEAPSIIKANASRADALAVRQALQDAGATATLNPIGLDTAGPVALPPDSTGLAPTAAYSFEYQDLFATPPLQVALDLDIAFADFLAAWEDGQFLFGLRVTDGSGVSDLYLAGAVAAPPMQVPEPSTLALLSLPLLGLLLGAASMRGLR